MIVDVDWVPTPGGEATVAMNAFADLAPHCPGAQGVLYDTALRGVHHQRLLRDLGWLSVNKSPLGRPARRSRAGEKANAFRSRPSLNNVTSPGPTVQR